MYYLVLYDTTALRERFEEKAKAEQKVTELIDDGHYNVRVVASRTIYTRYVSACHLASIIRAHGIEVGIHEAYNVVEQQTHYVVQIEEARSV